MKLLTVRELSLETGLSRSRIYRLVKNRRIPFIRLDVRKRNSKLFFAREKINIWLETLVQEPNE